MPAAYIDSDDVDAAITAAVRAALFADDSDSGAGAGTFFTDLIQKASERVKQACHRAGYTSLGNTTTSQQVQRMALAAFLALAYNRQQQQLPEAFYEDFNDIERVRTGQLPITDLTSVNNAGVGGHKFSETNSSVSGARFNIFARAKLKGY